MPTFYHGTRFADAVAMAGPPGTIDVTRGSGEFGRGFYTQDSKSNALTWAQNRFPRQAPCLLEVKIDDQEYSNLHRRALSHKQAARLTQRLRRHGTLATHLEGVDLVIGPLSGSRWIQQQKFESVNFADPPEWPEESKEGRVKTQQLPFMHFMVRIDENAESRLVTPSEVEGGAGGQFAVPLTDDGELFPVYQFHYSVYLGHGEYFPNKPGKESFHGFAATIPTERRTHLLLTFGLIDRAAELWLPREFWGPPFFWVDLPRALHAKGELLFPILRRVSRRSPLRYAGKARHGDFKHPFAELEPTEPKLFDRLLDEFHISIIGFDRKVMLQ